MLDRTREVHIVETGCFCLDVGEFRSVANEHSRDVVLAVLPYFTDRPREMDCPVPTPERSRKYGIFSLSLATLASFSFGYAEKQSTTGLRGQVHAQRLGMLLSEAEVKVSSKGKVIRSVSTDQSGSYKISGLSEDRYTISISLRGFRDKEFDLQLTAGVQRLLDVGMEVGRLTDNPSPPVLSGTVRQTTGKPLKDATITLLDGLDQQVLARATTDDRGRYSLAMNGSQLVVIVSKPGCVATATSLLLPGPLAVPKKGKHMDFTLQVLSLQ